MGFGDFRVYDSLGFGDLGFGIQSFGGLGI